MMIISGAPRRNQLMPIRFGSGGIRQGAHALRLVTIAIVLSSCGLLTPPPRVSPRVAGPNPIEFSTSGSFDRVFNATVVALEQLGYQIDKRDRGQQGGIVEGSMKDAVPFHGDPLAATLLGAGHYVVNRVRIVIDPLATASEYRITATGLQVNDYRLNDAYDSRWLVARAKKYLPPDVVAKQTADAIRAQLGVRSSP